MVNKTRLIILISSSEAGGAQVYIINLVECLKALYSVVVVCPEGYLYERLVKNDIEVIQSDISLCKVGFIRKYLLKQQKLYESIIINTHLLGTTFWTILALFRSKDYRLVSTLHQPIIYSNIKTIKKMTFPAITKYVSKHIDDFISVSKEIADSVFEYTKRKAHYIPNSVPDIRIKKVVTGSLIDKTVRVGIIGRLTPQKNHFCFLEAAKLITEKITNVHFYIIGDGELKESLKEQVTTDKLENYVTFTGFVDEPAAWVKELDIVVFSSDFEGTPLALLETMSIGVPIVATIVGGIPQVIEDGVDGLLVPPRDPVAIKDGVLRLYKDKELYNKIHHNSTKKMQTEYNYENNVQAYTKILNGEK
jgi:glycosyltransferase involved in cell wall biosynthesis